MTLGRIEKRTLLIENVSSFFGFNDVILEKLMVAASSATREIPFVSHFLSLKDRWHVMNMCMNRVSAIFGPFHVFFNEARRCKSFYRSAWYLYTLTSQQNLHHGRFFVTPYKPVLSKVDVGVKRLRIELVNEEEMREICSGSIKPPDWGFFNNRHRKRWELLVKMGELFENQLVIVDSEGQHDNSSCEGSLEGSPRSPTTLWQSIDASKVKTSPRAPANPRELAATASRSGRRSFKNNNRKTNIDNCIMRVHIPYPSSVGEGMPAETSSKDVVLFE